MNGSIFDEPSKHPLPAPEVKDHGAATIKGMISSLPFVGGVIAEELALVLNAPLSRRRDEWLTDLARRLHDLEGRVNGFHFEDLANNEQFVSATAQATQAALRTHREEKLEALRNAVLNTALQREPDDDQQGVFLALIDRLTFPHMNLLRGLHNSAGPRRGSNDGGYNDWEWIHRRQAEQKPEVYREHSFLILWIKDFVPVLAKRSEDFIRLLVGDLYAAGLTTIVPTEPQIPSSFQQLLTPVGIDFLKFISDPQITK
jgi:hypothetical protein